MAIDSNVYQKNSYKNLDHFHRNTISWKAVFAGLFISLMSMMAASALGLGIVGAVTRSAIESESNGGAIATGAGVWLFLSVVISLLLGGIFTARSSQTHIPKVGGAEALVVASLFFVIMISGVGNAVSGISGTLTGMVKTIGTGATDLSQNPMVQDTINVAIPRDTLKVDPKVFAQGLTARLLSGDTESAKNYFAYNTGMSTAEAEAKMALVRTQIEQSIKVAGDKAAKAASAVGWTLFVTFLIGLAAAFAGGAWGAKTNQEDPLSEAQESQLIPQRV